MKHVVMIPSKGGWNKAHIWEAHEADGNNVRLITLCRRSKNVGPSPKWMLKEWLDMHYPDVPLDKENPLEDKGHQCDKCISYWQENKMTLIAQQELQANSKPNQNLEFAQSKDKKEEGETSWA